MPILLEVSPSELNWKFDFSPQTPWAGILPSLGVVYENQLHIVAGFDKKDAKSVSVLKIEGSVETLMRELYPTETLKPLERLRFEDIFGNTPECLKYILELPLALQNYLDEKQVSIRVLKPLEYLKDWVSEITTQFLNLKPSSSQIREILDLLCDLKLSHHEWLQCSPKENDDQKWISDLFKLRNPILSRSDLKSMDRVQSVNWPRGVRAKWERQGDQGGITIQAHVANPKEFENLKNSLQKVIVEEDLWTP